MRVDCALLCDAATARDGLLFVLGGGITRMGRPAFPAPLNAALAIRVMVHPTEADRQHTLQARLIAEDGEQVGLLGIGFQVGPADLPRPGEELAATFAVPLHQVAIPRPGAYSFEVLIDDNHQTSIPFVVEENPGA